MRMHSGKVTRHLFLMFFIVCFFSGFALQNAPMLSTPPLGQFPATQATSLDKRKFHLPQDFSGQMNLVVISFAREQQHQVDTWIPAAQKIQSAHSKFSYYELPTMSSENLLYRWWFDAALRSNTTDNDLRSRILTAYVNKHKFRMSLRIANEHRVVAILVNQTGKVFWRADGSCTEQDKAELLAVLQASGI